MIVMLLRIYINTINVVNYQLVFDTILELRAKLETETLNNPEDHVVKKTDS